MLTVEELAERWSLQPEDIPEIVRERHVPYVWMGRGEVNPSRLRWRLVRFRERAIEKWEGDQETATENKARESAPVGIGISGQDDDNLLMGGWQRKPKR